MNPPKLIDCSCGHIPSIIRSAVNGINQVRVECTCGRFGGTVMFTKPEQRGWAEQTVADGWNLADICSAKDHKESA